MGARSPIIESFDPDEDFHVRDEPTLCVECDNVHPDTAGKAPFQWRCLAFKAPAFGGFVDPNWRPDPPYHKCQDRNDGACAFWTIKRQANV